MGRIDDSLSREEESAILTAILYMPLTPSQKPEMDFSDIAHASNVFTDDYIDQNDVERFERSNLITSESIVTAEDHLFHKIWNEVLQWQN